MPFIQRFARKSSFPTIVLAAWLCTAAAAAPAERPASAGAHRFAFGVIDPDLIETAYAGTETFRYDVSYTGGFKLGELHMRLSRAEEGDDTFVIHARITTDNGIFSRAYPIEDVHVTRVRGPARLPFHYEVWQQEGYSYEAHRILTYDQQEGRIMYWHNENEPRMFEVAVPIQNEFSSFFASRIMPLVPDQPFVVPTFADERRNEVVVMVRGRERLAETVLGEVTTLIVEPILEFSGLYDKRGDTVIWYTDDDCRVPVKVNSKLVLGSLTATLVAYDNPACPRYDGAVLEKYRSRFSAGN